MRSKYEKPQSREELNKCLHCGSLFSSRIEDNHRIRETICKMCLSEEHTEPSVSCEKCRQYRANNVKSWFNF